MKHHLHLLSKMKERGWGDRELDYARHVMISAQKERTPLRFFMDSTLLWVFLVIIAIGNLFAISLIIPLLVLFPNPAIYGILMLLGVCFGLLTQAILHDVEHLFSGHHMYIMYVLIPFLAASGGLMVLTYAYTHLPNLFFLERSPLKMSIIYTFFFILPLAISKYIRSKKSQSLKKEVL